MHSHRIVHRVSTQFVSFFYLRTYLNQQDVTELNIVVNCYRLDGRLSRLGQTLQPHRRTDNVYYAFMDYDQSIMLPSETCVKTCLRPIAEWQYGSPQYKPPDIAPGQLAYNPFAFDVGMLGNMFRCHFTVSPRLFHSIESHIWMLYTECGTLRASVGCFVRQDDDPPYTPTVHCGRGIYILS